MSPANCLRTISKSFNGRDEHENYLKGCKWSPDGLCILTASGDNKIRLFELDAACGNSSECDPTLTYNEGGTIYDYAWYPDMSSSDPVSCVFASCSKDAPVHLWDAFTGELRATYQPINQFDEVHPAYSVCFSHDSKLYCGFKKQIKIFDLSLPGRCSDVRSIKEHQGNIVSSIAINPVIPSIYALASYDKSVGIYTEPKGELLCKMEAHIGGVTQILFSSNGHHLFSGARMDNNLICWDLRKPGTILFSISRTVNTSQRIYFDLMTDGQYLLTGSTDGTVSVYSTSKAPGESGFLASDFSWQAHHDCANGVSCQQDVVATSSGQRHIHMDLSDEENEAPLDIVENTLKIWKLSLT